MKKFILFISVLHIFNCGTALASWTTIDVPGAFGTHVCGIDGSNLVGHGLA